MNNLKISCEDSEFDFSPVAEAFTGELESDCTLSLEIVTVDEDEIRRLNRELRSVDSVTDVLSFPSLEGIYGKRLLKRSYPADLDEDGNLFIGSIAVCLKRAAEQAEEYGHSLRREVCYLAVHGICHLLGYDHTGEEDKAAMRDKEERVLAKMGLER